MFEQLDRELHFGFQKNGSLVVAKGPEDEATLQTLLERGATNGVRNLRVVDQAELRKMVRNRTARARVGTQSHHSLTLTGAQEPDIHPDATAALWSPDAGTVVPYEFTIALAENAADNGVEFRIRREVTAIDSTAGGFEVTARQWETPEYAATAGSAGRSLPSLPVLGALLVAPGAAAAAAAQAGFATETMLGGAAASLGEFGACAVAGVVLACGYSVAAALLAGGKGPAPVGHGGAPVTVAEMATGGSGTSSVLSGVTAATEKIRCSYVVNCAGSASDTVARMVGDDSFKIKPRCALFHRHNILGAHLTVLRLGEYLLLHKNQGPKASATLFPAPGPMGKGVLVQGTLWGNLILGPTARDVHNPEHINQTSEEITGYILRKCKELVPGFDASQVIHAFAGARAKSDRNDWSAPSLHTFTFSATLTPDAFIYPITITGPD